MRFIDDCMKKGQASYDNYNHVINSKECHNATVNLRLPGPVFTFQPHALLGVNFHLGCIFVEKSLKGTTILKIIVNI